MSLFFDNDSMLPRSSQPLGAPLPEDSHACSVSLPTWASVVGYEEGDAEISSKLKCGYPRFVYHPYVLQLMKNCISNSSKEDCLVLPNRAAALKCQTFLQQALYQEEGSVDVCHIDNNSSPSDSEKIRVVDLNTYTNVHAVLFPAHTVAGMEAKAYWQHTGEIVSSRQAEACLNELGIEVEAPVSVHCQHGVSKCSSQEKPTTSPHSLLRERIAHFTSVGSQNVHLTTSGMSSIYSALLSSRRTLGPEKASIVFGFPYLDTLKLCSRKEFCRGGVEFFGHTNTKDLDELEQLMEKKQFCALFTEVPSNPLLQCPDLERLRSITEKHNVCLVVDDTIGNFLNISLLKTGLADVVCTSLTKLFSGRGDVMAGSLIANPHTDMGQAIQQDLAVNNNLQDLLFDADAWAIWHNSSSFEKRNARMNETASQLAEYLRNHDDVDRVYYPKYSCHYPSSHFGGLFSLLLGSHICQRTFYDALDVAKGPSLGTNFTLVCPYTLLAHYHELDFAMSYGVKPNLLRISVGLEPLEELREKFSSALVASRLHPKIGQRRAYSTMTCRRDNLRMALRVCMRGRGVAL